MMTIFGGVCGLLPLFFFLPQRLGNNQNGLNAGFLSILTITSISDHPDSRVPIRIFKIYKIPPNIVVRPWGGLLRRHAVKLTMMRFQGSAATHNLLGSDLHHTASFYCRWGGSRGLLRAGTPAGVFHYSAKWRMDAVLGKSRAKSRK